jgi:sarcosine oxidase
MAVFPTGVGPTMGLSTCLFTNSSDGDFIIDSHPDHANVVIGAGFSGHGFKFANVIGDILTEMAIDGATDQPTDPLRINRFYSTSTP